MSNSKAYPRPQWAIPTGRKEKEARHTEADGRCTEQKGFVRIWILRSPWRRVLSMSEDELG